MDDATKIEDLLIEFSTFINVLAYYYRNIRNNPDSDEVPEWRRMIEVIKKNKRQIKKEFMAKKKRMKVVQERIKYYQIIRNNGKVSLYGPFVNKPDEDAQRVYETPIWSIDEDYQVPINNNIFPNYGEDKDVEFN